MSQTDFDDRMRRIEELIVMENEVSRNITDMTGIEDPVDYYRHRRLIPPGELGKLVSKLHRIRFEKMSLKRMCVEQ